ncbi:MAG: sugar ABC transporter permease [Trebonia sp.]|uniref:carbohydrate ABC transporter permease n=1 Tax=Trebonia sp. TaxID=2767075 RepID=UPI003BB11B4A
MTALRLGSRRPAVTPAGASAATSRRARRPKPTRLLSRPSRVMMWGGLLLGVGVYVLFAIVPMVGNVIISFTDYTALPGAAVHNLGFSNYTSMFSTEAPGFDPAIVATLVFVVAVTLGQNLLALLFAHKLVGGGKFAAVGRLLVFLPIALGVTVVGLVWLLIFNSQEGPMTSFFGLFGIHSAFFGSDNWAMPLVILVQIWQNVGFSTLVFIGGLRAIDPALYEAAAMDGVGAWQRLRRITFPLLAPFVTLNVMLAVVGAFTTYNLIYVLTDGQYGTQTLGMLSYNVAFGSFNSNLGYGAAVSVVLFLVTLIVALPMLALLRRRERRLFG